MGPCAPLERLFQATHEAGVITGQTIVVDGGQTLPESVAALGG